MRQLNLLFLIFLLASCDKDTTVDSPVTYVFDRFETGEINVYAENIKLENQAIAADFANEMSDVFYQPNSFVLDGVENETITFISNNKSIMTEDDTNITTSIIRIGDKIYFETTDTLYSDQNLTISGDRRFVFHPQTQTGTINLPPTGFPPMPRLAYGYLSCKYAVGNGEEIKIPIISLLEKNCNSEPDGILDGCLRIQAISDLNNMFNINYLKTSSSNLTVSDTLVVQENFVVFRKRLE